MPRVRRKVAVRERLPAVPPEARRRAELRHELFMERCARLGLAGAERRMTDEEFARRMAEMRAWNEAEAAARQAER